MKIFNIFKFLLVFTAFSLIVNSSDAADEQPPGDEVIKTEVRQFFDIYLDTYNQRFGHPENSASFIQSLSGLIHQPFLMSPPTRTPFHPRDKMELTQVFDGFVQSLEKKGAVKLLWKSVNLQVLSTDKVLANNIGIAIDQDGEVVYETISIYLVNRNQNVWKISLFSPYELARQVVLKK